MCRVVMGSGDWAAAPEDFPGLQRGGEEGEEGGLGI